MWTLIYLGAYAILWAVNKYTAPKTAEENAKKIQIETFDLPRSEEAVPIPLFYGTVLIRSPVVLFARIFSAPERREDISGDNVVVGYKYRMMVQFLLGAPGNREGTGAKSVLKRIWAGERVAWYGELSADDDIRYVTKHRLLGGDNAGGGVEGLLSYLPGSFTQTNNSFLAQGIGDGGANPDLAYRGQAVVTLFGVGESLTDPEDFGSHDMDGVKLDPDVLTASNLVVRGWNFGESASLEGYAFEVEASCTTTSLGATVGGFFGNANPVNVLYDLVINAWSRLGLTTGTVDAPSWLAAAQTLATEGNGFSLWVGSTMSARDLANLVLAQIDGVLRENTENGTIELKLIRDDYVIGALPAISPANGVAVISYSAGNWNETFNQVRVTFTDRTNRFKDGVAVAQDQANYYASGGKLRSTEKRYPGCPNPGIADKLAARDLRALSLPLAKLQIEVNRSMYKLRMGDAFRFTWPEFNNMTDVVFRVVKYNLGTLDDEKVVLDCIQDQFAFDHKVFHLPPIKAKPYIPPFGSLERIAEEAPRWHAGRAVLAGRIVDANQPRTFHLAIPRGISTSYHAEVSVDGRAIARDLEPQPFAPYAEVETDYARDLEPYDTGTGLRITGLVGLDAPTNVADINDIATKGVNLIRVGDEHMAFETVTLISGVAGDPAAVWRLNNVWRALHDTAADAHAAGVRVYFLASDSGLVVSRVGRVGWVTGSTVAARHVPQGDSVRVAPNFRTSLVKSGGLAFAPQAVLIPVANDDNVINEGHATYPGALGARVTLAYPPVDVTVNGSKTPTALVEAGVDVAWVRRNRLSEAIVRGDAADEEPEAGTRYAVVVRKDGDVLGIAQYGGPFDYTTVSADQVSLSNLGYGELDVGAQALTPILVYTDPVSGLRVYEDKPSWQTPYITIDAPHWRNLILNGRFADPINDPVFLTKGWHTFAGTPVIGVANLFGGSTNYIHTVAAATATVKQKFSIDGFKPGNLTAICHFYHHNFNADANDTATVTLDALDGGDGVVATVNTTVTPSTTEWRHAWIEVTVPATATQLRVTITLTAVGDATPDSAVTEVIVRLGEMATISGSTQLLANPDFETGTFTNWTNASNSFVADTAAPLYTQTRYARPGDFAISEIYQDVAIPAGWRVNATAVLEVARANFGADLDSGEARIEAIDIGGGVLTSATIGDDFVSPADEWVRMRCALDIPFGAVKIRTRLIGHRVTGITCDTAFDDIDLRIHKHLDADTENVYAFDIPASQPLPADLDYWDRAWPNITPPDVAMFVGTSAGGLDIEPTLALNDINAPVKPAFSGGKFVGAYDATANGAVVTPCYEFPDGCDGEFQVLDHTFAAYTSATPFTALVFVRMTESYSVALSICGRGVPAGAGNGWGLFVDVNGHAKAQLNGDTTVTAAGTRLVTDRAVHGFAMVYDPTAQELRIIDEDGEVISSTAALGEIDVELESFRLGLTDVANLDIVGDSQIARLYLWDSAIATADLQTALTQGGLPDAALLHTRTVGTLASAVGEDDAGVLVSRFGREQVAVGYSAALASDGGTGRGLVSIHPQGNAITPQDQLQSVGDWQTVGATVTVGAGIGPEGFKNSVAIDGTNAQYRELRGITAGTSGTKLVAFYARGLGAATRRFALANAAGVVIDTWDYPITAEWTLLWHVFTTWDNSTPTAHLRWYGSTTGLPAVGLEICGPFLFNEEPFMPGAIPVGAGSDIGYSQLALNVVMPMSFNADGEIEVEGVCVDGIPQDGSLIVDAFNGSNDDDHRTIYIDSSGKLKMEHSTGAAANNTSATAAQTDWDAKWVARGRWCEAGLLDGASLYAGVIRGDTLTDPHDYGRVATWTPGTAIELQLIEIGAGQANDPMDGLVRRVVLRTREERLL